MEIKSTGCEIFRVLSHTWGWFEMLWENFVSKTLEFIRNVKQIGKDDPRRVVHSIKVGLALTLVSLFYYSQPLFDGFGVSAMWAVITVVVVFEFSVGATIGKGLNRILATLLAGALGVGAHHLAHISGKIGEPVLIGLFVFLQAAMATFMRFLPNVKARYDYGILIFIFILTFCLVSVSSYRNDKILEYAKERFTNVVIGVFTCVVISISIYPVWAGEELHDQVAQNIEVLGNFLQGFGDECFEIRTKGKGEEEKSCLQLYRSVLNSKSSEESMANFARWEPTHDLFSYKYPWKQYLKIGTLTRECACLIAKLDKCLSSKVNSNINITFKETLLKISSECGKALNELALSIKTMSTLSSVNPLIENLKAATTNLQLLFKSCISVHDNFLEILSVATVTSVLNDIVTCTKTIAEEVHELAIIAQFRRESTIVKPSHSLELVPKLECSHIIVSVSGVPDSLQIGNPSVSRKAVEV